MKLIKQCIVSLFALNLFIFSTFNVSFAAGSIRPLLNDAGIFDPTKESISIQYQLYKDVDTIEVRVKDFRGQIVDSFTFVELRAGDHFFDWEGNDNNGKQLPEGRYQFLIKAKLSGDSYDFAVIDVRIASIHTQESAQIPAPLPAEEHVYRVSGSLSSFYRYDNEKYTDNGEVRLRTSFDYREKDQTVQGNFSAIRGFHGEDTTFNGTQVMAEQYWDNGKIKGVFRDNLGSFDDPMQFFSDFKTERNKIGLRMEHTIDQFQAIGLIYDSEGDVDNREQGLASRFTYVGDKKWKIGVNYTMRKSIDIVTDNDQKRSTSQAAAIDFQLPLFDSFIILLEAASTKNQQGKEDQGYLLRGEYDLGQIRLSGSYIDLGEYFNAPFSDPLHHVYRDARGIEASVDYFMTRQIWKINNLATTVRFFDLTTHSNDQEISEIDASLRFGLGTNSNFFFSLYNRDDDLASSKSYLGSFTYKWNKEWSTRLQNNYSETDSSNSLRIAVDTSYTQKNSTTRFSVDWMKREIDYSRQSPYEEGKIRFDINMPVWSLQLQGKYSQNSNDSGTNFYGRLTYKPTFFHRYQMLYYATVGDQAAFSFTERFEVGLEVQY